VKDAQRPFTSGRPAALLVGVEVTTRSTWLWLAGAVGAPLALAAVLRPIEGAVGVATVTLALVVPVVVVAATGRWLPAVGAALAGAAAFDYLFTEPRGSLAITRVADVVATAVLLVVGLVVVRVSAWGRRQRDVADRTVSDVAVLRSMIELMAIGEDDDIVLITASFWLRELLALRDCRFDRSVEPASPATVEPGGAVAIGDLRWNAEADGLPGRAVDLPLRADGVPFARFVMEPTPAVPVLPDRLFTAAALADLVATWLHLRRRDGRPTPDA
jgi:hypothetical protein